MAKIVGNTVGIPNPQSDLAQTDERKADFVKNKNISNLYNDMEYLTEHEVANMMADKADKDELESYVKYDIYANDMEIYDQLVYQNLDDIAEIKGNLGDIESIAKGRATGYVFDTLADLDAWLSDSANTANLILGDNLYIRATDVPDYWWDGASKQKLETQKVDLTEYVKNTDLEYAVKSVGDGYYATKTEMENALEPYATLDDIDNVMGTFQDYYTKFELDAIIGDVDTALDAILAIQETIVGGVN